MKLSECKHGILVCVGYRIGMIVGITQNPYKEAVPLVQWQNDPEPMAYHHCNLLPYEG